MRQWPDLVFQESQQLVLQVFPDRADLAFGQGGGQVGLEHLQSCDDFGHELGPELGDVGHGSHASHQVGRGDVAGTVVLNQLLENLERRKDKNKTKASLFTGLVILNLQSF